MVNKNSLEYDLGEAIYALDAFPKQSWWRGIKRRNEIADRVARYLESLVEKHDDK